MSDTIHPRSQSTDSRRRRRSVYYSDQRATVPRVPPVPKVEPAPEIDAEARFEALLARSASPAFSEPPSPTTSTTSTLKKVRNRLRQLFVRDH
ncbi:hypothetical protein Slin14017_G039740 [Septoria linicola]|nr:hypothetical protein Slin14017_G039740 [Septoria linicola]